MTDEEIAPSWTHTYILRKDHDSFHEVISKYKFTSIMMQILIKVVTKLLNFSLTVHELIPKVWYQLTQVKSYHR